MTKQFSFGILTYNQEKLVIETLESIKYQILNYGKGIDIFLYVSDDCSRDNTVKNIKKWITFNSELFNNYEIITANENNGTVKSYRAVIDKIKTEKFKIIAGDDVFSCSNIFEILENKEKIVCYLPLALYGNKLKLYSNYLNNYLVYENMNRNHDFDCAKVMLGSYVNTPSIFIDRSLINDDVLNFISKFKLMEDDPLLFDILKINQDLTINFDLKIQTLYRMSANSVSNSPTVNQNFYNDLIRLKTLFLNEKTSRLTKFRLKAQINNLKKQKFEQKDLFWFITRLDRFYYNHKSKKYLTDDVCKYLDDEIQKNQIYYDDIIKKAKEFLAL